MITGEVRPKLTLGMEEGGETGRRRRIQTVRPEVHGRGQKCPQGAQATGSHEWCGVYPL